MTASIAFFPSHLNPVGTVEAYNLSLRSEMPGPLKR